jgi:hypothetical protein
MKDGECQMSFIGLNAEPPITTIPASDGSDFFSSLAAIGVHSRLNLPE